MPTADNLPTPSTLSVFAQDVWNLVDHESDSGEGAAIIQSAINICVDEATADLRAQLAEAQAECAEQARLNGMGSEREARLLAQLAERDAQLAVERAMADRLADVLINPFLFGRDEALSAYLAARQPTQDKGE